MTRAAGSSPPRSARRPRPPFRASADARRWCPGDDPGYVSSCLLDGVAATVWIDRETARALLPPCAHLARILAARRGKHPLLIEAWQVRAGRWESPSGDQHTWAQRIGELTGMSLGLGFVGATDGAYGSPGAVGALFRRWSETVSAGGAGSYGEVIMTLPATFDAPGTGAPHAFVAGMYTNSAVALAGDLGLQFGYRKRLAHITWSDAGRCQVESLDRRPLLTLDWRAAKISAKDATLSPEAVLPRSSLPFLSDVDGQRYATSMMERAFHRSATRPRPVSARVSCVADALEGLPAVAATVRPLGPDEPLGAFRFQDVPTRLTYPRHGAW